MVLWVLKKLYTALVVLGIKIILNCNIFHNLYCIFDQTNAALLSIKDFFQNV